MALFPKRFSFTFLTVYVNIYGMKYIKHSRNVQRKTTIRNKYCLNPERKIDDLYYFFSEGPFNFHYLSKFQKIIVPLCERSVIVIY